MEPPANPTAPLRASVATKIMPGHDASSLLASLLARIFRPRPSAPPELAAGQVPSLMAEARKQSCAPLLHYAFETRGWPDGFDPKARRSLRRAHLGNAARNLELIEGLEKLARALVAEGLRPIVFKGADLATRIYPTLALRPMNDVDLLVGRTELDRSEQLLDELGYRPWCPEMAPGLHRRTRHARLYIGPSGLQLDLHWSLVGGEADERAPDLGWFMKQSRPLGLWSHFSSTAYLLYLAAHMKLQHRTERAPLIWLIDLLLIADRPDVDWALARDQARSFRWTEALVTTLEEARDRLPGLWSMEIAEGLVALQAGATPIKKCRESAAPPPHPRPGVEVDARSRCGTVATERAAKRTSRRAKEERCWRELRTLSCRGRLRLLLALAFPTPAYLRWRYRLGRWGIAGAVWLFYPYRWASLFHGATSLLLRTRGREENA